MALKVQLPEGITHKTFLKQSKGEFWVGEKETKTQTSFKIEDSVVRDFAALEDFIFAKKIDRGIKGYIYLSSFTHRTYISNSVENMTSYFYFVHHNYEEDFLLDSYFMISQSGRPLYTNCRVTTNYSKSRSIYNAVRAVVGRKVPSVQQTFLFEV